jgi:hypothetical protein
VVAPGEPAADRRRRVDSGGSRRGADGSGLVLLGQFGNFEVGSVYDIEKAHFHWVGEFSGAFFSDEGKH